MLNEGRRFADPLQENLQLLDHLGCEVIEHGPTAVKRLKIHQSSSRFVHLPHDLETLGLRSLHTENPQNFLGLVMLDHIKVHPVGLKLVDDDLNASLRGWRFLPAEIGRRESVGNDADTHEGETFCLKDDLLEGRGGLVDVADAGELLLSAALETQLMELHLVAVQGDAVQLVHLLQDLLPCRFLRLPHQGEVDNVALVSKHDAADVAALPALFFHLPPLHQLLQFDVRLRTAEQLLPVDPMPSRLFLQLLHRVVLLQLQLRRVFGEFLLLLVDDGGEGEYAGDGGGEFCEGDVLAGVGEDGGDGRGRVVVEREVVQLGGDELRINEEGGVLIVPTQLHQVQQQFNRLVYYRNQKGFIYLWVAHQGIRKVQKRIQQ